MQFHVQLLQSSCVGCIVGGFVGRLRWGESGRGKVVSRSTTRFGGSTLASSSLFPNPLPDILLYNGLVFNIHFTNFSSPISFSVVSLFLYPSSCSSLPVRDAMQFHVQLLVVSLCGLHCRRLSRAVGVGRVGQREGRLADYNPLWRVNARLVFPLPDTLFPTFSFTTASSSIYISPTSSLPSPSLSFLYSSIRLVAPVFLCGLLCSSIFS